MFRALLIQQDPQGKWWLDVGSADIWPPRLSNIPTHCASTAEMPKEVREKLACLRMAEIGVPIEGVGRRVSNNTYWVYIYDAPQPKVRSL